MAQRAVFVVLAVLAAKVKVRLPLLLVVRVAMAVSWLLSTIANSVWEQSMRGLSAALDAFGKQDYPATILHATEAIAQDDNCYTAWVLRGAALAGKHSTFAAILNYEKAISIKADLYEAWCNKGLALAQLGLYADSIAAMQRAVEIDPTSSPAHLQLAIVYTSVRELGGAKTLEKDEHHFRMALQVDDKPLIHMLLGTLLLGTGRWQEGFVEDFHRHRSNGLKFESPLWRGEDLNNKHIFLLTEQGYGDKILSFRYIKYLLDKYPKAKITVRARKDLKRLLADSFPIDVTYGMVPADYTSSLHDIPMLLGLTWDKVPRYDRYLKVNQTLVETWKESLGEMPHGLKVGICWASFNTVADTIPPLAIVEFDRMPKINFVSLQK